MRLAIDRTGTLDGFRDALHAVASHPAVTTLLVLAADGNGHVPATTDPILRGVGKPVYGGAFPQVVSGRERLERGAIVLGLVDHVHATVVPRLSDGATDLEAAVAGALLPGASDPMVFVVVDGLARRIAGLVEALFLQFGLTTNYIGGGAGSLTLQQKPCVFTPQGMVADAAVLLQVSRPNGVGVSHGWAVVSEPLKVTRAEHSTVHELNHEPALDVYRRIVEPVLGRAVTVDGFFEAAMGFPFGMRKMDAEVVVRDPIVADARGAITCVGEVPTGSLVHVLRGEPRRLVDAARTAGERAQGALGAPPRLRLVIDCISRVLFLGDRFDEELAALDAGDAPMIGVLSLGEIANAGSDYLEFYNKTAVVGLVGGR